MQREFFPRVNAATARVLAMEGCDVVIPRRQGCCGTLSVHNGREAEAMAFARRTVDVFEAAEVEHVVVNAAGCGSSMKEYAELLRDDPAYAERAARFAADVRDVSEVLIELGPVAQREVRMGGGWATGSSRREVLVFRAATVVAMVHALDDGQLDRQPGVRAGQHLIGLVIAFGVAIAGLVVFPRLRPGLRAGLALLLGSLTLVNERRMSCTSSALLHRAAT